MLATLLEAKETITDIAGACPSSPDWLALLNQATRQLMRRGDWLGTVQPTYVCMSRGCVTWPRYVGTVRRMNACNRDIPVKGLWWKFLHFNPWNSACHRHYLGHQCNMISQGNTAVFQDIMGANRLVRAYPEAYADVGKTVTIFGLDENQQALFTVNPDGSRSPGAIITIGTPFGSTSTFVSRIERVLKDETVGNIRLYAYNPYAAAGNDLEDIATYEPSETNPDYVRYHLNLGRGCGTNPATQGCCGPSHGVLALVKLKFIPAKLDTDLVLIQNLDALGMMMQSIKKRQANDRAGAQGDEQDAIRELNLELADSLPPDQTAVSVEPFNGMTYSNQCF